MSLRCWLQKLPASSDAALRELLHNGQPEDQPSPSTDVEGVEEGQADDENGGDSAAARNAKQQQELQQLRQRNAQLLTRQRAVEEAAAEALGELEDCKVGATVVWL